MASPREKLSLTARVLRWMSGAIFDHRAWFAWPQVILAIVCIYFTWAKLDFLTSRNDLVGGDQKYNRDFNAYKQEFPITDDLVVVVESEDMEKNRQFVERLGAKLEAETNLFTGVFYKGDLKLMGPKALLFLPEKDLQDLYKTLNDYKPFLQQFTRATNLVSLVDMINTQFRTASREENAQNKSLVKALPALTRIIAQATDGLNRPGNPPSPGINSLFEGGAEAEQQMYITFAKGRIYLITAQARDEKKNEDAVRRMRELIHETQEEVKGLNVGLTGEPILEVDEMEQSQKDTTKATIVSLILCALIFIYGYNETGRPLKATLCLLVGLAYTMGFTTLAVGHLNILTITFVPILIGLAIDFGVHLITRYEEELRHGRSEREALEKAVVNTGMGIFTGALTTAGAFFAMAGTDFKGIREMGIICGGGLLVCLIPMMTLLPVLLLRGRQNVLDHELGDTLETKAGVATDKRARIENFWLRRPTLVIITITIISAACIWPTQKIRFDYNLLHMQSAGMPAVAFQDKLITSSSRSLLFGAVVANSLSEATNLVAIVTNLPTVGSVETMSGYLTEDQTGKLKLLKEVKQLAREIEFRPVDPNPVNIKELSLSLFGLHGYCNLAVAETRKSDPEIAKELAGLRDSISKLRSLLTVGDQKEYSLKLASFQQALFNDVRDTFEALQAQNDSGPLRKEDLPDALRNRFVGVTGKYLIQVYPKKDIWERKEQEEFINDLRKVYPGLTGTPVQLFEYTKQLKDSFQEAAWYSLIAITIMVFVHFRSVAAVILSLIPVAFGSLWMLGVMGIFNLPFNPANIMTLPLIIGIGVTNGIHILNRFVEEQHPSILAKSTGKAVLVSALTTIAGFGSLILAEHRGIRSLGAIMATGVATCMIVGLTFLPALLNLLNKRGWTIKKTQCDNARSTLGREEPR
jgi:hopanoid biosynthesis associated RND transporter like protein HpnN